MMVSSRLRKTFHYLESDYEDGAFGEMDEQEQESLIQELRQKDEAKNIHYTLIFTIISLTLAGVYVTYSFLSSMMKPIREIFCWLCILSFSLSAYTMNYLPLQRPDIKGKRRMKDIETENKSIRKYIRPANKIMTSMLVVSALYFRNPQNEDDLFWVMCLIPAIILLIIHIIQNLMISVDLKELEALQYDYKGA